MANSLTGEFDVVAQFGVQTLNRALAAQHQDPEVYLHSFSVRIEDTDAGVRGIAHIQVSTPTVTLPADENGSRGTIHYRIMAYTDADESSTAVPEFVHGEVEVTLDIAQITSDTEDEIAVDFSGDIEVTFIPDQGAPLSDEVTGRVNQIIRNFLRTGFDPVNAIVRLPGRGVALRVQHWRFKTMPGDQRPAVALLLNLSDRVPEAEHRAGVTEVFLQEGDDFAVAVGEDFLRPTLRELMRDALPERIRGTIRAGWWIFTVRVSYTVSLNMESLAVELGEGRIRFSVNGEVTTNWVDGTFTASQDFTLNADGDSIRLEAPDDPVVDLDLNLPFIVEFAEALIAEAAEQRVRTARDRILRDAGPLVEGLPGGFRDILPGLRTPDPHVVYTAAEIQPEGVIVRGTLDFGSWQDVVVTFEAKSTWPSETPVLLVIVELMFQNDLEQGVLSQDFRRILEELQGSPMSDHPVITTEEEGSRWRIDDQGKTYLVIKEVEALSIYDPVDPRAMDWEFNALNSWIPGGSIQRFRWVSDDEEIIEEHQFITRFTERLGVEIGENGLQPRRWCLEVSGVQGVPSREVSGWSCGVGAPQVGPGLLEEVGGGGFVVEVPDPGGGVAAHIEVWPPKLRPGGPRPRVRGGANLLVHFSGSQSTLTWPVLRDALAVRSRKDTAVFVVAVVPPALVVEPLRLDANIGWARTEDPEGAWAGVFRVTETPATFVVNPQGKNVWQQVGRLETASLIAAFNEHLVAGMPLRWQQLHLKVRVGEPAPDFIFEYLKGRRIALRTLRRRPVLLNFWKSWSAPCLVELRHLQKLHDLFAREGWVILAINDGEDPQRAREVFKEHGFTFTFVADADRQIAKLHGVNCWPTTVSINEKGIVRHIQFGVTPRRGFHVSNGATS